MAPKADPMHNPREAVGSLTDVQGAQPAECVRSLLRDLVDYAGLFPPAALPMDAAVANYSQYLHSEFDWILARFIVTASRLGEFNEALRRSIENGSHQKRWLISVLLGSDPVADIQRVLEFNAECRRSGIDANADTVEVKITKPEEAERISAVVPQDFETYFEIPWGSSGVMGEYIQAVAASRRRAKIRTGGETADKFPPSEVLADFLGLCRAAGLPFKATAGLHHPLRSRHRLTYQPDSPTGIMHGFLNVFLAAAFVRGGMDRALATDLLNEQSAEAFHFDSDQIFWRGHRLSSNDLVATRKSFSISFGSCSFTEPIDDLRSFHLL